MRMLHENHFTVQPYKLSIVLPSHPVPFCPTNPIVFTFYPDIVLHPPRPPVCSSIHLSLMLMLSVWQLQKHALNELYLWFLHPNIDPRCKFSEPALRLPAISMSTCRSGILGAHCTRSSSCIDMSNHTVDGVMWMIKLLLVRQSETEWLPPSDAFEWAATEFNHYSSWRFLSRMLLLDTG